MGLDADDACILGEVGVEVVVAAGLGMVDDDEVVGPNDERIALRGSDWRGMSDGEGGGKRGDTCYSTGVRGGVVCFSPLTGGARDLGRHGSEG